MQQKKALGEDELIPYPADIGPLLDSLPRRKRDYRATAFDGIEDSAWARSFDQAVFNLLTGRAPPPKNEDK